MIVWSGVLVYVVFILEQSCSVTCIEYEYECEKIIRESRKITNRGSIILFRIES